MKFDNSSLEKSGEETKKRLCRRSGYAMKEKSFRKKMWHSGLQLESIKSMTFMAVERERDTSSKWVSNKNSYA